jgi:hypothetical protein
MATTTTNYGWAIPQSTDLVKDGATAIATLGSAIDTSINTALGTKKAGMVLLNTTSFSGVSSQSVSDVFSATYENYRLVINVESAGSPELGIRMRVSGTDASSAIYNSQRLRAQDTTASAARQINQTYFPIGPVQSSQRNVAIVELNNPFATLKTTMTATMGLDWYELYLRSSLHDTATSYTGFTLVLSGSSISGKVSTYGYNL